MVELEARNAEELQTAGVGQISFEGKHSLKGISRPVEIYQATPTRLMARQFPMIKARRTTLNTWLQRGSNNSTGMLSTYLFQVTTPPLHSPSTPLHTIWKHVPALGMCVWLSIIEGARCHVKHFAVTSPPAL